MPHFAYSGHSQELLTGRQHMEEETAAAAATVNATVAAAAQEATSG